MSEPAPSRLPGLDGLRGVAILLVLVGHASGTRLPGGATLPPLNALGHLGVRLFFVLSGYLITRLVCAELAATGRLSLGRFWLRRGLRIFPAHYLYVGIMLALAAAGTITLEAGDATHALTYTVNYHHQRSWWVSHLWSLGVEEQFYVLWPVVLALAGRRDGLRVALVFCVAAPLLRLGLWADGDLAHEVGESFGTTADAIATGCLVAGRGDRLSASPRYLRFLAAPGFVLVPTFGIALRLLGVPLGLPREVDLALGWSVTNLSLALLVDRVARRPARVTAGLVAGRVLGALGVLSYSIYLWQQPFLDRFSDAPPARFPLNLALTFAAAGLSYLLVERPLLALRVRLRAPRAGAGGDGGRVDGLTGAG